MGTEYKLYEEELTGELCVGEASNRLELTCWSAEINGDRDLLWQTIEMSPAEMMKIFLEGIKVCSYWMSQEEFKKTMDENFEEYSV